MQSYSRKPLDDWNAQTRQSRALTRDTHEVNILREKSNSSSDLKDPNTRRSTFFSKRPKSGMTTTSNDSSTRSHLSVGGISEVSRLSSSGLGHTALPGESESSRSRFLFGRGRRSKAASSKQVRASSPVDADDESDVRKEAAEKENRSTSRAVRIPAPFGLQNEADKARIPTGVTENVTHVFENFRALRKGHRDAIIGPSTDFEDTRLKSVKSRKRIPPIRPQRPDELPQDEAFSGSAPVIQQALRSTRSVETFNHVPLYTAKDPHERASINYSPTQVASIGDDYINYGGFEENTLPTITQVRAIADPWERFISIYDTRLPGSIEMQVPLLNSTMIMDNTNDQFRTPMFCPPLEKVPEEPEGTFSNRQSRDYSLLPSLRHAKSSPAIADTKAVPRVPYLKDRIASPVSPMPSADPNADRPTSQGSDTLGCLFTESWQHSVGPSTTADTASAKCNVKEQETTLTWEDDIDYCYEHAAEADCDFNWQNISRLEDPDSDSSEAWNELHSSYSTNQTKREQSQSMSSSTSSTGDLFHLPNKIYRVPSKDSVREMELRPTQPLALGVNPDVIRSYDGVLTGSNYEPMVPHIPPRSAARNEKVDASDLPKQSLDSARLGMLPTPPTSADQSPVIPHDRTTGRRELTVNTIVAQLRGCGNLDSPVSPICPQSPHNNAPIVLSKPDSVTLGRQVSMPDSRTLSSASNSEKSKALDMWSKPLAALPTSMPRDLSSESVVTQIPMSQPPTPPKTPSAVGIYSQSKLNPPLPGSPFPQYKQNIQPSRFPNSLTPRPLQTPVLPQPGALPFPPEDASASRQRSGSAAARLGVSPSLPTTFEDSLELPKYPPSSSGRRSYSLFPSQPRRAPKPLDLRPVIGGAVLPLGPRSAGIIGSSLDKKRFSPPLFGTRTQSSKPR